VLPWIDGGPLDMIELQLPLDESLSAHAIERKLALKTAADMDVVVLRDSRSCAVHHTVVVSSDRSLDCLDWLGSTKMEGRDM